MTERVPGLEDVEAGDSIDEKTLYDPHTWLGQKKQLKKLRLSLTNSEIDSSNKETYQRILKTLSLKAKLIKRVPAYFEKASQKTFDTQHTTFFLSR